MDQNYSSQADVDRDLNNLLHGFKRKYKKKL